MCARKPGPAPQESKLPLTKASLAAFLVKHGAAVLQRTAVSQLWCPGVARGLRPGSCTLPPAVFALLLAVKVKPRLLQNSSGIPAPFEPFIGFALVYVELVVTYPWADGFCGPGIEDRIDRRPSNIQVSLLCFIGESESISGWAMPVEIWPSTLRPALVLCPKLFQNDCRELHSWWLLQYFVAFHSVEML